MVNNLLGKSQIHTLLYLQDLLQRSLLPEGNWQSISSRQISLKGQGSHLTAQLFLFSKAELH